MQATFQTRLAIGDASDSIFDSWGLLHGRVERALFAAYSRTNDIKTLSHKKSEFCAKFQISARHFNGISIGLMGKIASRQEVDKAALADVRVDLKSVRKTIERLRKQKVPLTEVQRRSKAGKTRRLAKLESKERRLSSGRVALCFGSRKLFRSQFDLDAGGFETHEAWHAAWQDARSNQFFLVGSKDETGGNQSCVATGAENGTITLRIRLPNALITPGASKYFVMQNIWFEHGQLELYEALAASQAISYRFLRDEKGWRVFASTTRVDARANADPSLGAVGVDINADHLAVTETDRFGNLVHRLSVRCVTHGKTANQRLDAVRWAAKAVVQYAARKEKPLVIEKLDFSRRKQELASSGKNVARNRQLSSFAYGQIIGALHSNALLANIAVKEVNPAYTSVIGRIKYARMCGISVHQSAALAVARRGMGFSEKAPLQTVIPTEQGDHLVFVLPVRNRAKHEWSHWASVRSKVQGTLAGYHRLRRLAALEDRAKSRTSRGPSGDGVVRIPPPNRQHNRSAGVVEWMSIKSERPR